MRKTCLLLYSMEEIIPAKVMSCIKISSENQKQTAQHPSGLCTVCQEIDFVSLTSVEGMWTCEECMATDHRHFHIGELRNVARKRSCPGCRLILSAVRSMDPSDNDFSEGTITIERQPLEHYIPEPADSLPKTTVDEYNVWRLVHVEPFIEVILDGVYSPYAAPEHRKVAGTIIRIEETEPTDSASLTSTMSEPNFRGRVVLPEVNTSLIRQWMQSCNLQHVICHLPAFQTAREQSIRLIDVQDHRVIPATSAEKYVALSYVWGSTMTPSLTGDTFSQCSSIGGLKGLVIPRTIMDAIQLVKGIGMRYLWVDSLCIVQDDDTDKQQQLTIMDSIYNNAELLVVAATGSDANAGLPGVGSTPRRMWQRIEKISGTQFTTAQPSLQQVLKWSVWNSRGWTFQEAILSRRALVFTESLVYWSCQVDTCREDINSESLVTRVRLNLTNSLWPHLSQELETCRTSFYCQLAEEFSQRALKEERDVVWAFVGILRLQTSHFQKGFIWGLPYEGLDTTLLWSESPGCVGIHSRQAYHAIVRKSSHYDLTYPSWSWLSTTRRISFMDRCGASLVSEVTWHEPHKFGDETSTTYLKSVSLKDGGDKHEKIASSDLLNRYTSERDVMDYGVLQFTAQTAVLTLRQAEERSDSLGTMIPGDEAQRYKRHVRVNRWVEATIHSPQGKQIGMLLVPFPFFNEKSERTGEFVLLSSNAERKSDGNCKEISKGVDCGRFEHVKGCAHIQSRNIMLIEWDGDIAYRRGLGTVDKNDWKDVKTEIKQIVLG